MGGGAEQTANEVEVEYKYKYGLLIIIQQYSEQQHRVRN
jgi:hypothetical protein